MPSVFKPVSVKPLPRNAVVKTINGVRFACWTNRKHKKVQAELTEDGKRCRVESPTWWVEYRAASGKPDRKKGFADKGATLALGFQLEREAEDVRSGRAAPRVTSGPDHLADFLPDFQAHLERKQNSAGHIEDTLDRVRLVISELSLATPALVNRDTLERWLDDRQQTDNLSARTRNRYAGALHQFGRWLVKEKKSLANPFDGLTRQRVTTDRRWVRRVLPPDDFNRLVIAARDSEVAYHGLPGIDRAMLYLLAAYTGYRIGALEGFTRANFLFDGELPTAIESGARLQKSKKVHTVPIHPDLAEDLAEWLASKPATGPLFTGWKLWADRGAELIQFDLAAARAAWIEEAKGNRVELASREASDRLAYIDHAGEVFDFHALRGQFITGLARAGVPLTAAQELADHSDPKLTANIYTKWGKGLGAEVAKLPAPGVRLSASVRVASRRQLQGGLGSRDGSRHQKAKCRARRKTKNPGKGLVSRGS